MSERDVLANQKTILKNQATLLKGQGDDRRQPEEDPGESGEDPGQPEDHPGQSEDAAGPLAQRVLVAVQPCPVMRSPSTRPAYTLPPAVNEISAPSSLPAVIGVVPSVPSII